MIRKPLGSATIVALAMTPSAAMAGKSFGEHGGYEVAAFESSSETDRGHCQMVEEFEGPGSSELVVLRTVDDPDLVVVSVTNYNWTIKDKEEVLLRYEIDDWFWDNRKSYGLRESGKPGLLTIFKYDDFMPPFVGGSSFRIYKEDVKVDSLNLGGSAAGKAALDRCFAYLVKDDAAKQKEWDRWKSLPKDPFKSEN